MTDVRDELEKEAEVTTAGESQDVVQESQIAEAPAEADVAPTGEPPAEGVSDEDAGDTASGQYDEAFPALEAGSIVKGRVILVSEDEVMVDVGYKSEGRIPLAELGLLADKNHRTSSMSMTRSMLWCCKSKKMQRVA